MKKPISLLLLTLLLPVLMIGCGSRKAVDLTALLSDIDSTVGVAENEMKTLTDVSDLDVYYGIAEDDVKQFAAQIRNDSSTAPVEIVLVEAVDVDAAERVNTALQRRYHSIVSTYASYSPEQLSMAKECGVTVSGNYVMMAVSDHYDEMMKIINASLG